MAHSNVRIKVRRRKVANLAAYSRQHTVNNIPKKKPIFEQKDLLKVEFNDGKDVHFVQKSIKWDEKKYPQPKNLRKRCHGQKWVKYKDGTVELKKWDHPSEFPDPRDYQKKLWKNLGKAAKMKAYEDEKMKKWERKHPKPCPTDDLFKDEFIPMWEKEREEALIHIRDFVVSMFDKLKVTASLIPPLPVKEILLAKIKDRGDDKNVEVATKIAKQAMKNNKNILHCQLLDHKEKSYRLVA